VVEKTLAKKPLIVNALKFERDFAATDFLFANARGERVWLAHHF